MLDTVAKATGPARKALNLKQKIVDLPKYHGRSIFVYSNIYTNQVVYSLERSLNNAATLKQLAYAGKSTVPRALRKDLWRPLCTILFPQGDQGRHAFQKLREWRRLHEVNWDVAQLPELTLSPEQKKEQKDQERKVRRQGGPRKVLTPHNLRKRKLIMDQKARSVADLAAVLTEQERVGNENVARIDETRQSIIDALLERALSYSNDSLAQLESRHRELRSRSEQNGDQALADQLKKLALQINDLRMVQSAMNIATEHSAETAPSPDADPDAEVNESRLRRGIQLMDPDTIWRYDHERRHNLVYDQASAQETQEREAIIAFRVARKLAKQQQQNTKSSHQPSTPSASAASAASVPVVSADSSAAETFTTKTTQHVRSILSRIRKGAPKAFSSRGVTIKWSNPLDAEYAPEWPRDVVHAPLGYSRHTAPPAMSTSPRLSVKDGLFDAATGRFVAAASRIGMPRVRKYRTPLPTDGPSVAQTHI